MLRSIGRLAFFVIMVLAASFTIAQADFSAEIVDLQKTGAPSQAKMYFTKDKIRIETQGNSSRGGAVIMNLTTHTTLILMPQQHMYMDMPVQMQAQRMSYASAFFQTGDAENACGDWQKTANAQGASCHKVGNETINGRSTVKYEATSANGDVSHFWLDPKLRFPIKWQGKNSDGEVRNIQEGAQPASLFEIPAGFSKMDMGAMMQQH
jgi:hypothetical protein